MGNPLGVYETMYKLKNEEKVFLREIWLASQNVTTRVSLLYLAIKIKVSFETQNYYLMRFKGA